MVKPSRISNPDQRGSQYAMKFLLVSLQVLTFSYSFGQFHRQELTCGINQIVSINRMFRDFEKLEFNKDCLIASKNHNGTLLRYTYYRSSRSDSVAISDGDWSTYYFDSIGRLVITKQVFGKDLIVSTYEYRDETTRVVSCEIKGPNSTQVLKYLYRDLEAENYHKIEFYLNGEFEEQVECNFDKNGNLILYDEYYPEGNQLVKATRYVGGFPCSPCKYDYDSKGNWIKKYLVSNGKRRLYAKRRIKYSK